VLAQAIYREGAKNVVAGANPMDIKRGVEKAVEALTAELKSMAKPVSGNMVAQVGTISANNDETIGKIIATRWTRSARTASSRSKRPRRIETSLEVVEGMQFDRGYLSPYFVTDPERMEVVLENPVILIHEKKISSMKDLLPVLEQVAPPRPPAAHHRGRHRGRSARDARGQQAARHAAGRRGQGAGFGDRRKAMLEDIAILTAGRAITGRPRHQARDRSSSTTSARPRK
jgi:chaperonin GroEL